MDLCQISMQNVHVSIKFSIILDGKQKTAKLVSSVILMALRMLNYVYPLVCNTLCYLSLMNKDILCFGMLCSSVKCY